MDSIRRTTGEVIGDPALIHQDITDVLREHYAMPLDFDNVLHYALDWQPYVDDKSLFSHAYRDLNDPTWCLDIFWPAVQRKPEADNTESKLQDLLGSPPCLAEVKEGIQDAKTNSARGLSGFSYNMLK